MSVTRDDQGRFMPGSVGNPLGRPARQVEEQYLTVTMQACTTEDWRRIVGWAVADAQSPNSVAARRYGREFLARIFLPSLERILVATHVDLDMGDAKDKISRLIEMLSFDDSEAR